MVTNFETENKYRIRNTLGQQIYFAKEGVELRKGGTLSGTKINVFGISLSTEWSLKQGITLYMLIHSLGNFMNLKLMHKVLPLQTIS